MLDEDELATRAAAHGGAPAQHAVGRRRRRARESRRPCRSSRLRTEDPRPERAGRSPASRPPGLPLQPLQHRPLWLGERERLYAGAVVAEVCARAGADLEHVAVRACRSGSSSISARPASSLRLLKRSYVNAKNLLRTLIGASSIRWSEPTPHLTRPPGAFASSFPRSVLGDNRVPKSEHAGGGPSPPSRPAKRCSGRPHPAAAILRMALPDRDQRRLVFQPVAAWRAESVRGCDGRAG